MILSVKSGKIYQPHGSNPPGLIRLLAKDTNTKTRGMALGGNEEKPEVRMKKTLFYCRYELRLAN